MVCNLALFFGQLFWLLFKKLGNFFQIIWSPVLRTEEVFYHCARAFGGPCVLLARTYKTFYDSNKYNDLIIHKERIKQGILKGEVSL